ncbi:MAG: hypothetical protein AAGD11_10515 [Planctomycetota bacterium]
MCILANRTLIFCAFLFGVFEGHAIADLITFSFSSVDADQSTVVKSVEGLTMTLSNPTPATFDADSDGLVVFATSGFVLDPISSFDIEFSMPVSLVSYRIGFRGNLEGNETITLSAGSSESVEGGFDDIGATVPFVNPFFVAAGQIITVVGDDGGDGTDLVQWDRLTVRAIPEPSAFLLMAAVALPLGTLEAAKRRR